LRKDAVVSTTNCELILALDLPDRKEALELLRRTGSDLPWVKIGLQMFCRYGPDFVREVADMGFQVFLDLKLHDIPNTVASAIGSIGNLPVKLLTVHAGGGSAMMRAAAQARAEHAPHLRLLAVTVLTSMDGAALAALGFDDTPQDLVLRLARLTTEAGIDGMVCSPMELVSLRETFGDEPLLVTPGIRPAGAAKDDQARITTPAQAREQGASMIVVGRPILRADDPAAAVKAIRKELAS